MRLTSKNGINAVVVMGVLLLVLGCFCNPDREGIVGPERISDDDGRRVEDAPREVDLPESDTGSTKSGKIDKGDFIVEDASVENPRYRELDRQLREAKVLDKAADKLNRTLILPYDIALRTKDCGTINAFYDPRDKSITFCYELMEHFFNLFKSSGDTDEEANNRMGKAVNFIFLHELGHALIDGYELPITANEEDAADRCSTYISIEEMGDEGVEWVIAAAEGFYIQSKNRKIGTGNLSDEHLLDEQRFFNSLCMIYGSNPTKYEYIVSRGFLPRARAERCPTEYARTAKSWETLLEPWRKD